MIQWPFELVDITDSKPKSIFVIEVCLRNTDSPIRIVHAEAILQRRIFFIRQPIELIARNGHGNKIDGFIGVPFQFDRKMGTVFPIETNTVVLAHHSTIDWFNVGRNVSTIVELQQIVSFRVEKRNLACIFMNKDLLLDGNLNLKGVVVIFSGQTHDDDDQEQSYHSDSKSQLVGILLLDVISQLHP